MLWGRHEYALVTSSSPSLFFLLLVKSELYQKIMTHQTSPLSSSLTYPSSPSLIFSPSLSPCLFFFPILLYPPLSLSLLLPYSPSSLPHSRKIPGICWPSQQEPHRERLPTARPGALLSLLSCQQCHHHRETEQEDVWRNTIHRCRIWAQGLVFCWRFYSEW